MKEKTNTYSKANFFRVRFFFPSHGYSVDAQARRRERVKSTYVLKFFGFIETNIDTLVTV